MIINSHLACIYLIDDSGLICVDYRRSIRMKVILDSTLYNKIWMDIGKEFNYPNVSTEFVSSKEFITYKIPFWYDEQELIVNEIFKKISTNEIYALDWQHDCFIYNPNENIPVDTSWYDEKRNANIYFPTYYPNGDYFAFVSFDYGYGLFGHPWKQAIYVVGDKLIELFEENKNLLGISEEKD